MTISFNYLKDLKPLKEDIRFYSTQPGSFCIECHYYRNCRHLRKRYKCEFWKEYKVHIKNYHQQVANRGKVGGGIS